MPKAPAKRNPPPNANNSTGTMFCGLGKCSLPTITAEKPTSHNVAPNNDEPRSTRARLPIDFNCAALPLRPRHRSRRVRLLEIGKSESRGPHGAVALQLGRRSGIEPLSSGRLTPDVSPRLLTPHSVISHAMRLTDQLIEFCYEIQTERRIGRRDNGLGERILIMFRVGDLLHNKSRNEDGRVVAISFEDDMAFYEVYISGDPTSAVLSSRVSHWPESEVEASSQSAEKER
jgi:hypothetical protein